MRVQSPHHAYNSLHWRLKARSLEVNQTATAVIAITLLRPGVADEAWADHWEQRQGLEEESENFIWEHGGLSRSRGGWRLRKMNLWSRAALTWGCIQLLNVWSQLLGRSQASFLQVLWAGKPKLNIQFWWWKDQVVISRTSKRRVVRKHKRKLWRLPRWC